MVDFILNDEQKEYQKLAREFAQKSLCGNAHKYDVSAQTPLDILDQLWQSGLASVQVPGDCGGLGLNVWDSAVIAEELAGGCAGISWAVETNALAILPVLVAAEQSLRDELLKPLVSEFSLAGAVLDLFSDRNASAVSVRKDGSDYILSGQQPMVGNAQHAAWYLISARSGGGSSLFAVPAKSAALRRDSKPYLLGRRAADIGTLHFDDVRVPASHMIGTDGGATKVIDWVRPHAYAILAAGCVGVARCAMEHSIRYAKERHTFGKPIAEHQGVAFILADMAKDIQAARLMTWQAAAMIDSGSPDIMTAAAARSFAQNTAMKVATDAVQVFGGYGYSKEYPVEKLMRDAKMYQLFDGSTQELNVLVGRELIGTANR
jgi:acyl-CoA dehydrogenase